MKLSPEGARFIAEFEGVRLRAYNDPAGHATVGVGHLIHRGPVTVRDRWRYRRFTYNDAMQLLQADAETAAACVRRHVRPPIAAQTRFDALVSFTFNLGCGYLIAIADELNKPGRGRAADVMLAYDHAGGVKVAGLTRRRIAERNLFLTGRYA